MRFQQPLAMIPYSQGGDWFSLTDRWRWPTKRCGSVARLKKQGDDFFSHHVGLRDRGGAMEEGETAKVGPIVLSSALFPNADQASLYMVRRIVQLITV